MPNEILVNRSDPGATRRVSSDVAAALEDGQIRAGIERFALTANNVSYAATGDMLGYYAYFPVAEEGWGRVPVWGFARVVESRSAELPVGERFFGILPMSSEFVMAPAAANALCFSDAIAHRSGLHDWYNRYYRCAGDPLHAEATAELQPALWALFMTGWMLARELAERDDPVDEVFVSSASSKTALSLAWAMKQLGGPPKGVGITSAANRSFVEELDVYARVLSYDELETIDAKSRVAYVDIAGNAVATSTAHQALGDRLVDSVLLGATHRAPSAEPLPMPGPAPRFFFIPDVAEEQAAKHGLESYHGRFAEAWAPFATWARGWLELESGAGPEAIEQHYLRIVAGGVPPQQASILSWS